MSFSTRLVHRGLILHQTYVLNLMFIPLVHKNIQWKCMKFQADFFS